MPCFSSQKRNLYISNWEKTFWITFIWHWVTLKIAFFTVKIKPVSNLNLSCNENNLIYNLLIYIKTFRANIKFLHNHVTSYAIMHRFFKLFRNFLLKKFSYFMPKQKFQKWFGYQYKRKKMFKNFIWSTLVIKLIKPKGND